MLVAFVPDDEMQRWRAVHALKSGTAVTTGWGGDLQQMTVETPH